MEHLSKLFEIASLVAKQKVGELSESEAKILQKWLSENEHNNEILRKLQDGNKLLSELKELKTFDEAKAYKKIEHLISTKRKQSNIFTLIPAYLKYTAALALLLVSSYFIISNLPKQINQQFTASTIFPGKQKAILITANNQQIVLDSTANKQIISNELAEVVNSGNTLSYNSNDSLLKLKNKTEYNTLITPRGGQYSVILSDGTQVMLNAGSKLIYPVVFNDISREVTLLGEAFFKVTKSKKVPFIVKVRDVNVTVYGTEFNVSSYNNESLIQTTLVEGSVGVSFSNKSIAEVKIKPGQQFNYNKIYESSEIKDVNTDQFIAWTKGMFVFKNEPIENILKVMSRWYDFEYQFKENSLKNQRFTLSLGKYDNVTKILDMISISSNMKFTLSGNNIIVNYK